MNGPIVQDNLKKSLEKSLEKITQSIVFQENIRLFEAISITMKSSVLIFFTLLMIKITMISSFHFLKDYPDENVLAAYGIGSGFLNVMCLAVIYSLNIGLLTRMAHAYGDKAYRLLGYYLQRGLVINILSFFVMAALIYNSDYVFALFEYSEELSYQTKTYLMWALPGIFCSMLSSTVQYYLLAINIIIPITILQVLSCPIYIISAYYFTVINKLGNQGSAFAFSIQNGFIALSSIIYVWIKNPLPQSMFCPNMKSFQKICDLFKHEFMIGSQIFIGWIGMEIVGLASGSLSVGQTSGFTATWIILQAYYMVPVALDNSVVTYVSNAMGSRQPKIAKKFMLAGCMISGFFGMVFGIVSYFFWDDFIIFLVETEEAIHYSEIMIRIYIWVIIPDYIQIVLSCCLRAIDKKIEGFMVTCISYAISIPMAYIWCFTYDWQIAGLAWGMNLMYIICFVINVLFLFWVDMEVQTNKIYKKIMEDKHHVADETDESAGNYHKLAESKIECT